MNGRSGRIAVIVLVGVLISPGLAHASLWDFIWKMSGPQMSGFPLHCEFILGDKESQRTRDLRAKGQEASDSRHTCKILEWKFTPGYVKTRDERQSQRQLWLSLDTGPYWSTGWDPGGEAAEPNYGHGEVWMVVAEPVLEFRSRSWKKGRYARTTASARPTT